MPSLPYYADKRRNVFSILSNSKGSIENEPYDVAVAPLTDDSTIVLKFEDPDFKEEFKPIISDLSVWLDEFRRRKYNLVQERRPDKTGSLLRAANRYVASLLLEKEFKLPHLILPSRKTPRKAKEKLITYRDQLRSLLSEFTKDAEKSKMMDGWIHIIDLVVEEHYTAFKDVKTFVSLHPHFLPTWHDLQENALVPSLKLGKYKSLYRPTEWAIITEEKQNLFSTDKKIFDLIKKKISIDNLKSVLAELSEINIFIRDNRLKKEVDDLRKERLFILSQVDSKEKKSIKIPGRRVSKTFHLERTKRAFNPFRILSVVRPLTMSSSELIHIIQYDDDKEVWVTNERIIINTITEGDRSTILSLSNETCDYLNS